MTYRELLYKATRLIDKGEITLGEYEEMTKPLDREVEQEPILDKIRADIQFIKDKCLPNSIAEEYEQKGLQEALDIIDKYKGESEDKE